MKPDRLVAPQVNRSRWPERFDALSRRVLVLVGAFVMVIAHPASAYDPERGHREAWISGIARNLHANDWKRRGRRPALSPPERHEVGHDDLVLDRLEACTLLAAVAVAMAELSAGDLAVLAAAALTEVTPGARTNAQYVRLHRARARLRGLIG